MNIKLIIQEEVNDFDWTGEVQPEIQDGMVIRYRGVTYDITDKGASMVGMIPREELKSEMSWTIRGIMLAINKGSAKIISESNDFDWTDDIGANRHVVGDKINNMNGFRFGPNPVLEDTDKFTVNGYDHGVIREVHNGHMTYGIELFNTYGGRGLSTLYYFSIEDIDNGRRK